MQRQLDSVSGRSILGAAGLSEGFVQQLSQQVADGSIYSESQVIELARRAVAEFEPLLAEHLSDSVLSGWITGYDNVAQQFPPWLRQEFSDTIRRKPPNDPPKFDLFKMFDGEPRLRLVNVENAAARLMERGIMTRAQFDDARDAAKRQAFTIAGGLGSETIDRVRFKLYEELSEGPSLKGFRDRVEDILDTSPLAPGHLENVYRTNLQAAYRDGRETLRSDPIVSATFPYQAYFAVHDARARKEHRLLETLGLNGTNVYRVDDIVWDHITPPWGYNCVLPGSKITGKVELLTRMKYSGKAAEIITKSGNVLRVTVNHPVLTNNGFLLAKQIVQGMYVVSDGSGEDWKRSANDTVLRSGPSPSASANNSWRPSPNVDEYKSPAAIDEIFSSLLLSRKNVVLPLAPDDFYGDSMFSDGNVDIVSASRELLLNANTGLSNGLGDFIFPLANFSSLTAGHRLYSRVGSRGATPSNPCRSALLDNGGPVLLESFPFNGLSFGLASESDARAQQIPCNAGATKTVLFGECEDRFSSQVFFDEIVSIRYFDFDGHVYDAQTPGGWFCADGIIISNCRCSVLLYTLEKAASVGVREAQEWLRTGRAPVNPEYRFAVVSQKIQFQPGFGHRGNVGTILLGLVPNECPICC